MILQNEDFIKLLIAIVAGGLIGAEREYRDKVAGLRTNIFICVGATLFTIISSKLGPGADPGRVAANIVSGVGFLGAGAILRERGRVVGLTTAATIWLTAAIGMGIATGQYFLVGATEAVMLAVLLVFPYFESVIGRWRDTRIYTILMPVGSDPLTFIRDQVDSSKLRTWNMLRTKLGDQAQIELHASGRPASHRKFMQALYDAEHVTEYRVM